VPASSSLGLPDDPTILLGGVARILSAPDLTIGNLEGTLTSRGSSKCGAGSTNCYAFRSPPTYSRLLSQAGFDVMNLANNHAFDYGRIGLADTHSALRSAGLQHTGAPGQVTVEVVDGVRIAVIGFASYTWSAPLNNATKVRKLVQKADGQADIVVVVFHGGAEGSDKGHVPNGGESQFGENRGNLRAFARTAVDAGADLVIGSGPHVVRGMQFYKGRLIAYSAGNFVGYRTFSLSGALSVSYVLEATLKPDGTWVKGRILPTRLVDPGYAATDSSGAAITSVRELSKADFGASAPRIGDDGTILPPAT
jgi:poly-gamma-glutamate capsule biosynthesis protein CapA/YwtB (metallophosphatase superfamily)